MRISLIMHEIRKFDLCIKKSRKFSAYFVPMHNWLHVNKRMRDITNKIKYSISYIYSIRVYLPISYFSLLCMRPKSIYTNTITRFIHITIS